MFDFYVKHLSGFAVYIAVSTSLVSRLFLVSVSFAVLVNVTIPRSPEFLSSFMQLIESEVICIARLHHVCLGA